MTLVENTSGAGYAPFNSDAQTAMNQAWESAKGRVFGGEGGGSGWSGKSFTPEQIASTVTALRNAGVAEEKIAEALKADGYAMPGTEGEDARSESQREFDQSSLAGNNDPAAYRPNLFDRPATASDDLQSALGHTAGSTKFHVALDEALRKGAAAMGLPATVGTSLIEIAAETAARYQHFDPETKSAQRMQARFAVEKFLGQDAMKEAQAVISRWRNTDQKLVDSLVNADYLSDPRILSQLVMQYRREKARGAL